MSRPTPDQLAYVKPADLEPCSEEPDRLLQAVSAIVHYGDSSAFRRTVMEAAGFPSDDVRLFLVVNQLALRGAMRPTDLAEALQTGPSNVTKLARRLAEGDLAVRTPDPSDERGVLLVLTPHGRAVGRRIVEAERAWMRSFLQDWSEREVTMLELLFVRFISRIGESLPPVSARSYGFPISPGPMAATGDPTPGTSARMGQSGGYAPQPA